MNQKLCIILLFILSSCLNNKSEHPEIDISDLTVEEKAIVKVFASVDSLLTIDNGGFWKKQIYGPILLVNPETREFYSNENNESNSFLKVGPLYKDSLPADINIANTAIEWNGKKWAMVMLPLPIDISVRNDLVIHELFHRIQPEIGFDNLEELENTHLDSYQGRLLIKLEFQALEKALKSTDDNTRLKHIQNALIFRSFRHKTPAIKNAENSLELNEGLAEYTAILLSGRNGKEMRSHLIEGKNVLFSNPTFVRSFAYYTVPLYGYLLSHNNKDWHNEINRNINLTDYFIKSFKVNTTTERTIAEIAKEYDYSYDEIDKIETIRENERLAKIAEIKIKFVDNPTLDLFFQNMNISFDPRNLIPIETLGTLYPNLRITDNWGLLTVENGALLASDWNKVTLSEPNKIEGSLVEGDGWKLQLNPHWEVHKSKRSYTLKKL